MTPGARYCGECGTLVGAPSSRGTRGGADRQNSSSVAREGSVGSQASGARAHPQDVAGGSRASRGSEPGSAQVVLSAVDAPAEAGEFVIGSWDAGLVEFVAPSSATPSGASSNRASASDSSTPPSASRRPAGTGSRAKRMVGETARWLKGRGGGAGSRASGADEPTPSRRTCPHCGGVIGPSAKFCRTCGKAVGSASLAASSPAARTCPHCGSEVGERARFCRTCGRQIA